MKNAAAKRSASKKQPAKKPAKRSVATSPVKKSAAGKRPAPSTKPLWQKLFVKGGTVLLVNAPAGYDRMFEGSSATVVTRSEGLAGTVLVFASDTAEFESLLPTALAALGPSGSLWIAYRKGGRDLHRDTLVRQAQLHGFTGVALVAVDATWSALRIKRA